MVKAVSALVAAIVLAGIGAVGPAGAADVQRFGSDPGQWLPTQGNTDNWAQKTAKCRGLLAKLDLDDPLVKKYLPNVRDKVVLVRRTPKFDWRTITAVEFLENMLTDLTDGKVPNKRYAGRGIAFPYWSEALERVQAIWLHVPPGYDPEKEYQLFMYYKCGGGIHYKNGKAHGGYRPTVEVANQTDTFHAWSSLHIQIKGRMNADTELMEAVPAMTREFSISPDRVFLTGWSDGGFTAMWLASRYPQQVAGIAPNCANWQYTNVNQVGLYNVPFLVVDGWYDSGYVSRNFSRFRVLHSMGADIAGLWGQHGHAYRPYEDVEEFKRILDWAKGHRRNLYPKRVRYATWNLSWHGAFWVSIERMGKPWLAAQIDAEVKQPNRIEVRTWNVGAYSLAPGGELLDPAKPVTVVTNGKQSYVGPLKDALTIELGERPEGKFVKSADMPGGITVQAVRSYYGLTRDGGWRVAGRRWLWVKPTGGSEKVQTLLRGWGPKWAKADGEVTDEQMAEYNLFLYGGPDVNKLTARMAADLPVKFGPGRFSIGGKVYDQPANRVKFIHPNPLNPAKYVVVYAFNDPAVFAANRFSGMTGESTWAFRSGDCVVMGLSGGQRKWGVAVGGPSGREHHIFDSGWRPADRAPVGELTRPFDTTQILRLRAEAAREATGADVGIVFSYSPGLDRWKLSLPAGPVSVHDIATTSAFPEYVTLGEVRGDALRGMVSGAAATTVLADKRESPQALTAGSGEGEKSSDAGSPLVLAEIQADKTYRVAMGYYGLPSYGADPRKMPGIFHFRSPEDFLAGKHVSLSVRNMRQLPLEMTEAVARYIARRGKVAPRPICFDLTQYLMNPQANEFGACDWLHLGFDVAWERPGGAGTLDYRYTLSLGLRAAADAELARPRTNSKSFLDVDLSGEGGPARFDFATLDKKLQVLAGVPVERFAIAADEEGKSFKLVAADAAEGVVGHAVLVGIRLANKAKHDVAGVVALAPTTMQRIGGTVWPKDGGKRSYYVGYHHAVGPRGKPPVHEDAVLWVFDGPAPKVGTLSARKVGYNFGLIAVRRAVSVKAGQTISLPLLLVAVDKPKDAPAVSLTTVLAGVREHIVKKLFPRRKPAGAL